MRIVKEILDATGKRKVEIIQRADGSCGFSAWVFSDDPLEKCWIPIGRYSECYAPDADRAESEARGRVDWLRQAGSSTP